MNPSASTRNANASGTFASHHPFEVLQPQGWAQPKGYANGLAVEATPAGKLIFVSGTIGWDAQGQFQTTDFVAQTRQALQNIVEILRTARAAPEHIVRMTWYVVDKREYVANLKAVGAVYREVIGRHFPTMTAVQVAGLIEDEARLEIEVTAVIP